MRREREREQKIAENKNPRERIAVGAHTDTQWRDDGLTVVNRSVECAPFEMDDRKES